MNCETFRAMIGSYIDETLEEDRRLWFRSHLRGCTTCREAALLEDPSLLFTANPLRPTDSDSIEDCVAGVSAGIRQDRLERRLRGRRRPWMAAAAAAVMVVSGGIAWRAMTGGGGSLPAAAEASRQLEKRISPPSVEVETAGEEVRVYQFATDGDADTAVYFIVDPALEL